VSATAGSGKTSAMTPEQFRRLALALPEVVEGEHHRHPDFRAHGQVIASLHPDGERAMVKVPVPLQQQLVASDAAVFAPATGAWGRAGCTMLVLGSAKVAVVRDALANAWQFAAANPRSPRASAARKGKPGGRKTPSPRRPRGG
jgi:hypothetical protein